MRSHCWPLVTVLTVTILKTFSESLFQQVGLQLVLVPGAILFFNFICQIFQLVKVSLKSSKTLLCIIRSSEFDIICKTVEVHNQIIN